MEILRYPTVKGDAQAGVKVAIYVPYLPIQITLLASPDIADRRGDQERESFGEGMM